MEQILRQMEQALQILPDLLTAQTPHLTAQMPQTRQDRQMELTQQVMRLTPRIQPDLQMLQIPQMEQIQQIQPIPRGPQMERTLRMALITKIALIQQDKTQHKQMEQHQITVLIQMVQDLKIIQIRRFHPITVPTTAPTALNSPQLLLFQQMFSRVLVRLNLLDSANL